MLNLTFSGDSGETCEHCEEHVPVDISVISGDVFKYRGCLKCFRKRMKWNASRSEDKRDDVFHKILTMMGFTDDSTD